MNLIASFVNLFQTKGRSSATGEGRESAQSFPFCFARGESKSELLTPCSWSTEEDAAYGLDVTMPGTGFDGLFGDYFGDELVSSVRAGGVSEARLDDMAIRTLSQSFPFFLTPLRW